MLLFAWFLWQTTFQIAKIDIQGLQRFEAAAVIKKIGLPVGSKAGKPEFDAACQKILSTGLFEGCNWKYAPAGPGAVSVIIQLDESPAEQTVRLTIPGTSDKQLWDWFQNNEPLVQPKMPASDAAIEFYTAAIKRFLKQDVVSSIDLNLRTKETTLVFRPANVPSIESLRFEGSQAIRETVLADKINPIAKGSPFSEYDVTKLLDLNIRPLYEALGYLDVKFAGIKADGGKVTVQVQEGIPYKLGTVTISGTDSKPNLPAGQLADWQKVTAELESAAANLRNQGFLEAKYDVTRKLNADTVDLAVVYTPGKQFVFGELKLSGLNATQQSFVRPLWQLKPGAPMNEGYIKDYIAVALPKLGPEFNGVASQLAPRPDTNTVDVEINFRRQ